MEPFPFISHCPFNLLILDLIHNDKVIVHTYPISPIFMFSASHYETTINRINSLTFSLPFNDIPLYEHIL